jgi:hypothetical protein
VNNSTRSQNARPSKARTRGFLALCLALAAGCGSDPGATDDDIAEAAVDAGSGSAHGGDAGHGSDAGPAATFSEIYAMLFPAETNARCNFCHSMRASDTSNGKLSMGSDKAAAYAALVGKTSTSSMCMGKPLVVAKQPDMSLLVQKVLETPPCGSRMPVGGMQLSDTQVAMIRSWIAAGAKND